MRQASDTAKGPYRSCSPCTPSPAAPTGSQSADYIDWACDHAGRMLGVELEIGGETDEERAAAFVEAMVETELAERLGG